MNKPLQDSLAAVKQCQSEVHKLLTEQPQLAHVRLEINRLFERIVTRLSFSGAILEPETVGEAPAKRFPPITQINGKQIKRPVVTAGDLIPEEADIAAMRKRTQQLYDSFLTMKTDVILSNHKTHHDQTILRAVAKWAGVEDYETDTLNESFINLVKEAIKKKNKDQKDQKQFRDNLSEERKQVKVGDTNPQNNNATEQE